MNNLEWLYEHDRDKLVKLLTGEYISCDMCYYCHDYPDCGGDCERNVREWLDDSVTHSKAHSKTEPNLTEQSESLSDANDDFTPESVVTGEIVDTNDANAMVTTMPLRMPSEIKFQYVYGESCNQVADQGEHSETPPASKWQSSDAQKVIPDAEKYKLESNSEGVSHTEDSREKLESDALSFANGFIRKHNGAISWNDELYRGIIELLNRQAEITERDFIGTYCHECQAAEAMELKRRIAELTEQVSTLTEFRDRWRSRWTERNAEYDELLDYYDELKAERDEWKAKAESALHENPYVGLVRGKQWERTEISDYYCGRCGWKVTDHDSYCPECGGALHKTSNKPDSKFDARKTAETPETDAAKGDIRDFDADSSAKLEEDVADIVGAEPLYATVIDAWNIERQQKKVDELHDSREKLEADMRERLGELWADAWDAGSRDSMDDNFDLSVFIALLDRQAAITEREIEKKWSCFSDSAGGHITELTEQLESAHAKNRALKAHIAKMQEGRHGWHIKGKELQQQVDSLKDKLAASRDVNAALRDEWHRVCTERDHYRELCGKLLDAADEMRRVRDAFDQFERGEA